MEAYVPQDPPQEGPVVFGYIEVLCEHYTPIIYSVGRGSSGAGSGSDWGDHLRTTGPQGMISRLIC